MSELLVDTVVEGLRAIVGDAHVLVDADMRAGYEVDWLGKCRGVSRCVVRPGTAEEVAAVVRRCAESGVAVVPQGGNTGLVGGSVPRSGEVLLSTRRLTTLGPVDTAAMQVTAERA
jgi:FAD/FMN-containing dehydrogenase